MTQVTESLIEKIRKLLRMTVENGCSEAEAAAAAGRARKLLDQYNITMIDVAEKEGKPIGVEVRARDMTERNSGVAAPWQRVIAAAVAALYDCRSARMGKTLQFIGDKMDCEVCAEVYLFIVKQIRAIRINDPLGQDNRRSWFMGAARRISHRIGEIIQARKAELAAKTTALVVRKSGEIERWMNANAYGHAKPRTVKYRDAAYGAGYRAGGRVQIHKSIQ